MERKIMKRCYEYMKDSKDLKVGVYEASHLASICGINTATLVYLGTRANAVQAPIELKEGWYIYMLEARYSKGKTEYYLTIDNILSYKYHGNKENRRGKAHSGFRARLLRPNFRAKATNVRRG